ncbi:MAG: TM2 domain-containing protein [Bacteroidota bacterium]
MSEENNQEEHDSNQEPQDTGAGNGQPEGESTADNIQQEAKSTVNEIKEGWNEATNSGENKKLLAGLLAIFVGYFGVHKFILGYNKEGFILLGGFLIGVLTYCFLIGIFIILAVGIVSLIEGIIYLTKSDEEFYQTYQVGRKPWF